MYSVVRIRFLIIVIAVAVSTSIDVNQVYGPTPFGYDGNYPRDTTGDYDHCFDYVTDPEYGVKIQTLTHRLNIENCKWEPEPTSGLVHDQDIPIPINENCEPGTTYQDGICLVSSEQEPDETFGTWEELNQNFPQPVISAFDWRIGWFYQYIVNSLSGMINPN